MSLLLAPYTNAMRLGQGFNSYTQQICVDDAVVIDPNRAENIVTNDGTTMRIAAELTGKPSAWHRIKEVVKEGPLIEAGVADSSEDAIVESSPKAIEPAVPEAVSTESTAEGQVATTEEPAVPVPESEQPKDAIQTGKEGAVEETEDKAQAPASENGSVVEVDAKELPAAEEESKDDKVPTSATAEPVATPAAAEEEKKASDKRLAPTAPSRNRSSSVGGKKVDQSSTLVASKSKKYQVQEIPVRQIQKKAIAVPEPEDEFALEKAKMEKAERLEQLQEEKRRMAEHRAYQREIELERRKEQTLIRQEQIKEQQELRAEKLQYERERRAAAQKSINDAVAANKDALTLEQLNKIKAQNQFADRFDGMVQDSKKFFFDPSTGRGTSQTVTYSSKFIDKLSDITDDMCISGALSVKMAKIGGSGRGSFVDSDKFKESDLSFYISVKVVNQTVNFKDALEFNKLRSVDIGSDDFNKVYGDSFISGFVEGGEFNAVVSMKVHNKAKLLDIKAEAKVALTTGPVDITAEANVGIARTNLEMNTETTIQVSWCGGGNIKPMDQPWNIESIMEAAARFPELVANCPQRTYAILTKYDTLRSFVNLRPASFSPLQYENAQIYTNMLMDAFMSYKSIYKKLGDQSFSIQNKTLEFEPIDPVQAEADATAAIEAKNKPSPLMTELKRKIDTKHPQAAEAQNYLTALEQASDISRFDASLKGISDARKFIRRQMVYIVNEVDLIEKDPKVATDQDHEEPFQSPLLFESRLAATKIPERLKPRSDPLGGRRIMAKTQTETELEEEQKRQEAENASAQPLYSIDSGLTTEESESMDRVQKKYPQIGKQLRASMAVPKAPSAASNAEGAKPDAPKVESGSLFNNLEFLFPEWQVEHITIGIAMGRVVSIEIKYDNGLILQKGMNLSEVRLKTIKDFQPGERITSVAIEIGELTSGGSGERVLSICMYTTRGRRLLGQAVRNEVLSRDLVRKDGIEYKNPHTTFLDAAFSSGSLKGFFGRLDTTPGTGGLTRVGVIWGDDVSGKAGLSTTVNEVAPMYDIDESSTAATIEAFRGQIRTAEDQTQAVRYQLSEAEGRERLLNEKKTQFEETIRNLDQEKQRYNQIANAAESERRDIQSRLEGERNIIIGAIVYGGRNYIFNRKINNKVRDCILRGQSISLSNDFFEEDPQPGVQKSGAIMICSARGEQTLAGVEGHSMTFQY